MQDFRKLRVWQESQQLAADVFGLTRHLRGIGGLTAQLRRSVESVPSNISEGSRRRTAAEFAHYLQTAISSSSECESQLDLLLRLKVADPKVVIGYLSDVVRIRRQLISLRKRVMEATPETKAPSSVREGGSTAGPRKLKNPKPQNTKPPTDQLGAGDEM